LGRSGDLPSYYADYESFHFWNAPCTPSRSSLALFDWSGFWCSAFQSPSSATMMEATDRRNISGCAITSSFTSIHINMFVYVSTHMYVLTNIMMMIAVIIINGGLVFLIEGLCAQISYFRFEIIGGLRSHLDVAFITS